MEKQKPKRKTSLATRVLPSLFVALILINLVAMMHAYSFTHFSNSKKQKTKSPENLSFLEKLKPLFLGINNPRPMATDSPSVAFETLSLQSNVTLSAWYIKTSLEEKKGTVIFFHGYGAEKSSMLSRAMAIDSLGYDVVLLDLMGAGASGGNTTTIGYKEVENVKTAFAFVQSSGEKNIYLFGTSMGAAAVMKAMSDEQLKVSGLILECPYGSLYQTVCARFKNMGIPSFPMARLLVFWGGAENGFWAFDLKPEDYAKNINTPTLLMYGEKDQNVSMEETQSIFANLQGDKTLKTFPLASHENYMNKYHDDWLQSVATFLNKK